MTLILNVFGGPGAGKSTTAAGVFRRLKLAGITCEYVQEYAKDLVWERRHQTLDDQIYIFGKQYHRIYRLLNQVEAIVTDSPIILGLLYKKSGYPESFDDLVMDVFHTMTNMNYMLKRVKPYSPVGRNQTEAEAKDIDKTILGLLLREGLKWTDLDGDEVADQIIAADALVRLGRLALN